MIEHLEVDGRAAFVMYLNDELQPVDKGDETLIRVLFKDNGDTLWLVNKPEEAAEDAFDGAYDAWLGDTLSFDASLHAHGLTAHGSTMDGARLFHGGIDGAHVDVAIDRPTERGSAWRAYHADHGTTGGTGVSSMRHHLAAWKRGMPRPPAADDFQESKVKRDPEGKFASQAGAKAAAPTKGKRVAHFKSGVHGRGIKAADTAKGGWVDASPFQADVNAAMAASHEAQAQLGEVGEQIAKRFGIEFKNPGVKTDKERIMQKLEQRGGNAARLTDLARGAFLVKTPEQAQQVVEALGEHFGVADEGWRLTPDNYADRSLNLHFPNGLIGEIQVSEPQMFDVKMGEGHKLYEEMRVPDISPDKLATLRQRSRAVYGAVLKGYSPAWLGVLGLGAAAAGGLLPGVT